MKKQPRKLTLPTPPEDPPVTAMVLGKQAEGRWVQIRTEYITSPHSPSIDALAKKYASWFGFDAIKQRATREKWTEQKERWWTEAEVRLLANIQDEYLKDRMREMAVLKRGFDALAELALPLTDKAGNVLRDEAGLPKFAYSFRSQDKVIRALLDVQERGMLLRGEAIMRTESEIRDRQAATGEGGPNEETFNALAGRTNFKPSELRTLARQFLLKREEALREIAVEDEAADAAEGEGDDEL